MRGALSINPIRDNIVAVSGYNVIDDTQQKEIGRELGFPNEDSIPVMLEILDLTSTYGAGTQIATGTVDLTYLEAADFWILNLSEVDTLANELRSYFQDGNRYVATVKEVGTTNNMRSFQILEFTSDEEGLEKTLMELPYQIEKVSVDMYIRWYDNESYSGDPVYQAKAYEGSTGTIGATDASRITHRGGVVKYNP